MIKKYIFYLVRWQLSTPILAACVVFFASLGSLWSTIIANFIGGLIFFWVDRIIFLSASVPLWEIQHDITCNECGAEHVRGYRLVTSRNYDRRDAQKIFLCEACSVQKTAQLRTRGVEV